MESSEVGEVEEHVSRLFAPVAIGRRPESRLFHFENRRLGDAAAGWGEIRTRSGFSLQPKTDFDMLLVTMPLSGKRHDRIPGQVLCADPEHVVVVNTRLLQEIVFGQGLEFHALTFAMHKLHRLLSNMTGQPAAAPVDFHSVLPIADPVGRTIATLINTTRMAHAARLPPSSLAKKNLEEAVLLFLLEALPHSYAARLRSANRLVEPAMIHRAIEYMHAHAAEPIRLLEIADHVGVSIRCLQVNFMRYKGVTPVAYLRELRLKGARQELLHMPVVDSIGAVGMRWGFASASRFSRCFRAAFGESPVETLRARRQ